MWNAFARRTIVCGAVGATFAFAPHARCQAALPYAMPSPYFRSNLIGLSFLQSASSDWSQGPQNFLAAKFSLRMRAADSLGPLRGVQTVTLDLGVRASGDSLVAPVRVGENELFAETRWALPRGWMVDPYVGANLRTPVTESFLYYDPPLRTAKLWDPVVSYESVGFQYSLPLRTASVSARAGIALKQTRARDNTLLTDNPFTPEIERYHAETGVEMAGDAYYARDTTLVYTGKLDLFTTFKYPSVWAARWENELRVRLWNFIGVTVDLQVVNDVSQTSRVQFRQEAMLSFFAEP